jgi:hypothetical protein
MLRYQFKGEELKLSDLVKIRQWWIKYFTQ